MRRYSQRRTYMCLSSIPRSVVRKQTIQSRASNHFQLSRCGSSTAPNLIWQGRTRWAPGLQEDSQHVTDQTTSIMSWLPVVEKWGWPCATPIAPPHPPPHYNPLILHDHTPHVFRPRWAFIMSESTKSKYCILLGKYSLTVLMSDSGSISVWGKYYIYSARPNYILMCWFYKTCDQLMEYGWLIQIKPHRAKQ